MALMPTNILPTNSYPFGPTDGKTGLRHLFMMLCAMQEGVAPFAGAGGDYKVTQRAAGGAGQALDVAAGDALIVGDDTARQGIYEQTNDAVVTVPLPAASAAQPRFDQLVLHVYDSSITGGSDTPQLEVLQGTAQAGVTIDNRLGAAALPNNAIRLAEWVTPASAGAYTILNAAIRDRRPWARGGRVSSSRATIAGFIANPGNLDAASLDRRLECSGVPLRVILEAGYVQGTAAASRLQAWVTFDGGGAPAGPTFDVGLNDAAAFVPLRYENALSMTPGSHKFSAMAASLGTGSWTITGLIALTIFEDLRSNVENSGA